MNHYKVFKTVLVENTVSELKLLNNDERIIEIAEMLSGKDISDSAVNHAKALLNWNPNLLLLQHLTVALQAKKLT